MAITNMEQMVNFYQRVFGFEFEAVQKYGTTLYLGKLSELELLLCPNQIAQVDARQGRHQLEFLHPCVQELKAIIVAAGGKIISDAAPGQPITVYDPDGNTIVLSEK